MLINLTCPAEVFQALLPTEEFPAANLSLYNLSDRVIVSVEVTLKLLNGSGAEKERVIYRARALNGRPHSTFRMNVPCTAHAGACSADVTIDKVWYNDNDVWRRELSSSVEYTPNTLPPSPALTNLKFAAGETAVGYPSQQDGLWVCVCGRPNPDGESWCARCRRQKETVFSRYNREAVETLISQREKQLDLATRSIREDTARMQRIREEEYHQVQARRKRRLRLALCLPLCILLTAAAAGIASPALRMLSARRSAAEADWTAAVRMLDTLGDFPGAKEQKAECVWQEAKAMAGTAETAEELKAAAAALRRIPDRPESLSLAEETDLARAGLLLDAGDPEAARDAVSALQETDERRIALENECLFAEAKAQLSRGEYEDAREAFLLLADAFPEAKALAAECIYMPACELISEGRYDEAIGELSRIPEHPQSRDAILECHYKKAAAAEEAGDLSTASAEYLMAGEYGDAPEKTQETVFALAEQTFASGDTEAARQLFASLPGYGPAAARVNECSLILARQAMEDREYEQAAELLATLPEGYEGAAELIPQAAYQGGLAAAKRQEWEKAAELFRLAGDTRDAPSRLEKALESLIRELLDSGNAARALELLPEISGSKKYGDYLQEADYLDALAQAGEGGDPAELEARFEAMGNYRDAPARAGQMRYLQARQAEALGETLTAARLYARAAGWNDAAERAEALFDLYYGERTAAALEAMENGDPFLAVTLLDTLDRTALPEKYADLGDLYDNACLKAGETLYQAGRPYEAARYFRLVGNERRTSRWLNSACYLILGSWADRDGNPVAEFREDSTCTIAGETFTFLVPDSYTLKTETDGEMKATFRITTLTENRLSLRDTRDGRNTGYEMWRAGEASAARPGEEASESGTAGSDPGDPENPEDFTVKDGE